jgi:hypothetical protein
MIIICVTVPAHCTWGWGEIVPDFSKGYLLLAGGLLGSMVILAGAQRVAAEGWEGEATGLDRWSSGIALVTAQAEPRFDFDIPAETLGLALSRFQQVTGLKVAADSKAIAAARTPGLHGTMTAAEALAALLSGTGLGYRMADARTVAIEPKPADDKGPVVLNPIPVTAEGARSAGR